MIEGEWLSPPRIPGEVSLRQTKHVDRKPSKGIVTVAEGSIFFLLPQLEVGALTASLLNALVGVLLIWPLPYRVSRTFTFFISAGSAWVT